MLMKCRDVPCTVFFFFFPSPQVPVFSFGLANSGINLSHLVPEEQQSSAGGSMNHRGRSPAFKRGWDGAVGKVKNELAGRTKDLYWGILENLILQPGSLTVLNSLVTRAEFIIIKSTK